MLGNFTLSKSLLIQFSSNNQALKTLQKCQLNLLRFSSFSPSIGLSMGGSFVYTPTFTQRGM